MLKRIAYTGKVAYHGTSNDGRHRKRKEPLGIFTAHHPPLIDQETFDKAQEICELRQRNPTSRNGKPAQIYPLTGLLFCGFCGGRMRGVSKTEGYQYYADANQIDHTCRCSQRLVPAERIEQQIVKWVADIVRYAVNLQDQKNDEEVRQLEARFDRVTKLYLCGEVDNSLYRSEKVRLENAHGFTKLMSDKSFEPQRPRRSQRKSQNLAHFALLAVKFCDFGTAMRERKRPLAYFAVTC
jgi:hypothetical protein